MKGFINENKQINKEVNLEGSTVLNRETEFSPAPSRGILKKINHFMVLPQVS